MIAAVFDLDRTLLPDTTAERIFLRRLFRSRVIGIRAALRTVRMAVRAGFHQVRVDRPYLTGQHEAAMRLHGRRCAISEIIPRLSTAGIACLKQHQQQGRWTVLLSGSLPYVVDPIAERLGFDDVICSRMLVRDQRLVGGLSGLHPYGDAKATLMSEIASRRGLDLTRSWCYADHHTDEALLQMFGYPVCVNPSEKLRAVAENRDWRIERFD